jgi:hypothetical protein
VLRYTIELVPKGDESRKRVIGVAEIANVGGTKTIGNYSVRLRGGTSTWTGLGDWRRGSVQGFPRLRQGAWDLMYRALHACIADRNRKVPAPSDTQTSLDSGPLDNPLADAVRALREGATEGHVFTQVINLLEESDPQEHRVNHLCAAVLRAAIRGM